MKEISRMLDVEIAGKGIPNAASWKRWAMRWVRKLAHQHALEDAAMWVISSTGDDVSGLQMRFGWWRQNYRVELKVYRGQCLHSNARRLTTTKRYPRWVAMRFVDQQRYEAEVRAPLRRLNEAAVWGTPTVRYEYDPERGMAVICPVPEDQWQSPLSHCGETTWRMGRYLGTLSLTSSAGGLSPYGRRR